MSESEHLGRPNSDRLFLVGTIVIVVLLSAGIYVAGLIFGYSPSWYQGYAPEQPIPFSHRLHAGQYKVPCLYCHGSAEYAAHAEVPGLELCMNCHQAVKIDSPWIQQMAAAYKENKPIKWVKVHVLPDFVRFNHKRHIAAGVECSTCHGAVQEMDKVYQYAPLTMGWCVNCHRNDDYLKDGNKTEHDSRRVEFAKKKWELQGKEPNFVSKALGHPDPHNADVSCSTCHY